MLQDCYRHALEALRRHLDQAGMPFDEDDGDLMIDGHRIGLSISFDGFGRQQDKALAPLDICIHLDGDEGNRFRVGTIGIGDSQEEALAAAVDEWHVLAAAPVLAALGAESGELRRGPESTQLAGWDLFPGRAGIRGDVPPGLHAGGSFFGQLLLALRSEVSNWPETDEFVVQSVFVMGSGGPDHDVQAAVNGFTSESLTDTVAQLPWPASAEPYFYKQLFVLRCRPKG